MIPSGLEAEWHPTMNLPLLFNDSLPASKKFWWVGSCDHLWDSTISNRRMGKGCPICSGHRILVGFNDLATINPLISAEWHPTKNGELEATQIGAGTEKKVWWLGKCGHEWDARVNSRALKNTGCPVCSNRYAVAGVNDLATTTPVLAAEWHPTKNGSLTPQQITSGTSIKVWWLGKCSHEWAATASSRSREGRGCPVCAGQRVLIGFNDLTTTHPVLAAEWHPTKNGELTAQQVTAGSGISRIWWLGKCEHEWVTSVANRTSTSKTNCPFCSNQKILVGFNDLATTNPKLAAEWHPTKNEITPHQITAGSNKKAWWLGECEHEWQTVIAHRHGKSSKCPVCLNQKLLTGFNDLATTHPELASQWHPTKNLTLKSNKVSSGTNKKVWWLGECRHEWDAVISSRVSGVGCPVCAGQKILVGFNDLAFRFPDIAMQWHPTKNGILTAEHVSAGTTRNVWWLGKCGHEWENTPSNRTAKGQGCPVCVGRKVLHGFNDLASQYPKLALEWHPTKNGELTPENIYMTSYAKVWWRCRLDHEWSISPSNRIVRSSGCPVCSNKQVLAGYNDLTTTHPTLAAEWHPTKNDPLTPQEFTAGSNRRVWWMDNFSHEWITSLSKRTVEEQNCPVCSGNKILVGFNDLATTHPQLVIEWHPTKNGSLTPEQVTKGSGAKAWWLGQCKHEWQAAVASRSVGVGCPKCAHIVSRAEIQIKEFLEELGLIVDGSNRTILGGRQEIDLWIPTHSVGIEFNGIYWHKEKFAGKTSHHDKWLATKKAGIRLIQIWEDDWSQKPDLVKRMLAEKLGISQKVLAEKTDVITITERQAEEFLTENHIQGFASGSYYLGLVSKGDIETLRAVMVLQEESGTDGKVLNIVRYATSADVGGGFNKLLDYAKETYKPESFIAISDHCMSDGELYENNGFIAEKTLPPDYMYVVKNERKHRSEYPLERFHSDSKLLWEEGLTEMELADLNGLDRIWNAGKTYYRLIVE